MKRSELLGTQWEVHKCSLRMPVPVLSIVRCQDTSANGWPFYNDYFMTNGKYEKHYLLSIFCNRPNDL
jgi:hypothetical protein